MRKTEFDESCPQMGSFGVHTFQGSNDRCIYCDASDPDGDERDSDEPSEAPTG